MNFEELKNRIGLVDDELQSNWHHHKNPDGTTGGWVENCATVAPTAYVGPEAVVQGVSWVRDTSQIRDGARVIEADVRDNSLVAGQAIAIGGEYRGETVRDEVIVRGGNVEGGRSNTPHPRINSASGCRTR